MGLVLDSQQMSVFCYKVVYFSAYIQIKNDNHTNCLQTKIWHWRSDCTKIDTKYGGKKPALTYKISLWIRTGILRNCTAIHTCCMLLIEPSQRTWKLSDGTAVFNYTQQAEVELEVRTWHGDTLQRKTTQFPSSICFSMLFTLPQALCHVVFSHKCFSHTGVDKWPRYGL